jgi:hypothetical protein
VRTGYLFCHTPGVNDINDPSPNCNDEANNPAEFCSVASSTQTWTCPALDFYDAEGNHVNYSLLNGALVETIGNGAPQSITGDTVSVQYLQFVMHGMMEGDNWNPRITISMGITPSSTDVAVQSTTFNLQTTVSARTIDCIPGTQSC